MNQNTVENKKSCKEIRRFTKTTLTQFTKPTKYLVNAEKIY